MDKNVITKERLHSLEEAVREFAGYYSSDDVRHWQLLDLADGRCHIEAETIKEYLAKSKQQHIDEE